VPPESPPGDKPPTGEAQVFDTKPGPKGVMRLKIVNQIIIFLGFSLIVDGEVIEREGGYSLRADIAPLKADIEPNLVAERWVTKELLLAFDETDLGVPNETSPNYRFFIELQSDKPTLLKYLMPALDRKSPSLIVKQLARKNGIWTLSIDKEIEISKNQEKILQSIFQMADPLRLPSADWEGEGIVGGRMWVYEFCLPDGFVVMARRNPFFEAPEDELVSTGISKVRFAKEMRLSAYLLMLCTKADIQIDLLR
jgi:hypothetical protein